MVEYQKCFEQYIISQGLNREYISRVKTTLALLDKFCKTKGYKIELNRVDVNTLEEFYLFLKNYKYRIADNTVTGYIKNPANRNYVYKKFKPLTIIYKMSSMKLFFSYLQENDIIVENPFDKFRFAKTKFNLQYKFISQDDLKRLVSVIDTTTFIGFRDRTIVEIVYGCALRLSEVQNLDLFDIDMKEFTINVRQGKGHKDRIIPIGKVAMSFLKEYISKIRKYQISIEQRDENALFLSKDGNRLSKAWIYAIIKQYARTAKLYHISTHKLRHTFAVHMLRQGCDIRYIQEILGHRELSSTTIYTQIYDKDLKDKIQQYHPRNYSSDIDIFLKALQNYKKS